jgi:hypothetical protein
VKWYLKAAEQGMAGAQWMVGFFYERGQGVPQDFAKAAKWYRKTVELGDAAAQYSLGWSYYRGQGVSQDCVRATPDMASTPRCRPPGQPSGLGSFLGFL